MTKTIFLDYASATPLKPVVLKAMGSYFQTDFYNPSALYNGASKVRQDIQLARQAVASILQVKPTEVYFTAGSTEANSLAINGVMNLFSHEYNILCSTIEHDSVLKNVSQYNHAFINVDTGGILQTSSVKNHITDKTILISCMLVNNELGTIQPLNELAKIIASVKSERLANNNITPLYLHCDASQAFLYLKVLPKQLNVDMLTLSGGKIYGPKQSAILYVRTGLKLKPLLYGGNQESSLRPGTENVASIIGLAKALEIAHSNRNLEVNRLKNLQDYFVKKLLKNIPNCVINGDKKHVLPNFCHVTFKGVDNEKLIMQLDNNGIMAAVGSACNAGSDQPSHVLSSIGMTSADSNSSVRFSFGVSTTKAKLDYVVKTLIKLLPN